MTGPRSPLDPGAGARTVASSPIPSSTPAPTTTKITPHEAAQAEGWDLFQHDGYWYVHNQRGGDRRIGGDQQLGAGPSQDMAMDDARTEAARREAVAQQAETDRQERESAGH